MTCKECMHINIFPEQNKIFQTWHFKTSEYDASISCGIYWHELKSRVGDELVRSNANTYAFVIDCSNWNKQPVLKHDAKPIYSIRRLYQWTPVKPWYLWKIVLFVQIFILIIFHILSGIKSAWRCLNNKAFKNRF